MNTDKMAADALRERDELAAEVGRLKTKLIALLRSRESLGSVIAAHCIAMQSALIEYVMQPPGSDGSEAMKWLINTLRGPGLLPDADEARRMGGAQAWFKAKTDLEDVRRDTAAKFGDDLALAAIEREPATIREIAAAAVELARLARESGYVLAIFQVPRTPLAMGNEFDRVRVHKSAAARRAEAQEAEQALADHPGPDA